MKRTDLLNVLWAETIAKTELDWAEMANHKMDIYEKVTHKCFILPQIRKFRRYWLIMALILKMMARRFRTVSRKHTLWFPQSVSLVSLTFICLLWKTLGPIEADDFSMFGKILVIPYVLVGAPICLLIVGQIGRMITSVWTVISFTYY